MGLTPTQRNFRMQMAQFDEDGNGKLKKGKPPKFSIWLIVLFLFLSISYFSGFYDYIISTFDKEIIKDAVSDRLNFGNSDIIRLNPKEKESVYNYYAHYTKLFNSITMFSNDMLKDLDSIPSEDLEIVIDRLNSAHNYYVNNEVPDFLETTNEIHVNQITASLNFMNGILKYKQSNQISDYNLLPELSRLYGFWNDSRREHMLNDFDKYKIDYEINNINIRFWLKKNNL